MLAFFECDFVCIALCPLGFLPPLSPPFVFGVFTWVQVGVVLLRSVQVCFCFLRSGGRPWSGSD